MPCKFGELLGTEIRTASSLIPSEYLATNSSITQIYGDPHFNTFDLKKYDFMGQCDYVLAMDCEAAKWFVYGRMRPCGRGGEISWNNMALAIKIFSNHGMKLTGC